MMRVVVINLDRSPERLAEFGAEAARCGLDFERLPAIDGRLLADRDIARWSTPGLSSSRSGAARSASSSAIARRGASLLLDRATGSR